MLSLVVRRLAMLSIMSCQFQTRSNWIFKNSAHVSILFLKTVINSIILMIVELWIYLVILIVLWSCFNVYNSFLSHKTASTSLVVIETFERLNMIIFSVQFIDHKITMYSIKFDFYWNYENMKNKKSYYNL